MRLASCGCAGGDCWNEFSASDVIKMMKSWGERKKNEKTIIQLSNSFAEICGIFVKDWLCVLPDAFSEAIRLKVLMEK